MLLEESIWDSAHTARFEDRDFSLNHAVRVTSLAMQLTDFSDAKAERARSPLFRATTLKFSGSKWITISLSTFSMEVRTSATEKVGGSQKLSVILQ